MAKLYEVWNQVDSSQQRGYVWRSLTLSMLNSAWYCGTKAFRGSVRILTREPSSKECKLTTTGRRPTNSGIIPNSTRSRASTWLSSLSRSALSSRTSGWEFLKMSSSFSFEPRSLIGAPKPITWIEERLVSKGQCRRKYCRKTFLEFTELYWKEKWNTSRVSEKRSLHGYMYPVFTTLLRVFLRNGRIPKRVWCTASIKILM